MEILQEYYAANPGSWISLAILVVSILTSWALNYSAPNVRVFGTVLAASGCLAVAAWFFFFVVSSGLLENPKPNQTPMDLQNRHYYGCSR